MDEIFCASSNTKFSTMLMVTLLSQCILIGHSGAKSSSINKSLTQTISQVTFVIARWLRTRPWHHTLLLSFSWHKISSKDGRSSINGWSCIIRIWKTSSYDVSTIWIYKLFSRRLPSTWESALLHPYELSLVLENLTYNTQ